LCEGELQENGQFYSKANLGILSNQVTGKFHLFSKRCFATFIVLSSSANYHVSSCFYSRIQLLAW